MGSAIVCQDVLVGHGAYCTIHGGDVLTALYTNTAPPFIWRYRDANDVWHTTDQTGPTFSPAGWGLGSYLVECRETSTQTVAYVASDTEWVTAFTCQPSITNIVGAGWSSSHNPTNALDHRPHVSTNITYFAQGCANTNLTYHVGFDHDKVKTRNLVRIATGFPQDDDTDHCLAIAWEANGEVDISSLWPSFCDDVTDRFHVRVDGVLSSVAALAGIPRDFRPLVMHVELADSQSDVVLDRLWIVSYAPATDLAFQQWYSRNSTNLAWTAMLPRPYPVLTVSTNWLGRVVATIPSPTTPNPWQAPTHTSSYLHHNAVFSMRSESVGGHGNQACYDGVGLLIRSGIAGGTADFGAASLWNVNTHIAEDVDPFLRAVHLDGNPGQITTGNNLTRPCLHEGSRISQYLECRPVIQP